MSSCSNQLHNEKNPSEKTVLITGASTGIGFALAKKFLTEGYKVVITANNIERLTEAQMQLNKLGYGHVEAIVQNLACIDGAQLLADELNRREMKIDILVNNAGFSVFGVFEQASWAETLQMLQLNVLSLTQLTRLLLPDMVARNSGKILNLGSTGSFLPGPDCAVYCATKAYVLSFSNSLAEELKGTGVTVTTICPGATATRFAQRSGMAQTRIFQGIVANADVVANTAFRALQRGRIYVIDGMINKFLVGLGRFMPICMLNPVARWFTQSGS